MTDPAVLIDRMTVPRRTGLRTPVLESLAQVSVSVVLSSATYRTGEH